MVEQTSSVPSSFEQLCRFVRETAALESVQAVLEWDERTMLPPAAGPYRAEQLTQLSGWLHQRQTDPRLGQWLAELADNPLAADAQTPAGATIRRLRREYEKRCKLPERLVMEETRAAVLGQQAWSKARRENDFRSFQPFLETIVRLKQERAAALGYSESPYDALLDEYEPEEKTARVAAVLQELEEQLVPLVQALTNSDRRPPSELLSRSYPVASQEQFARHMVRQMGFDFDRGRLDVTDHPFCTTLGPHDCRITTRYDEHYFSTAFFGTLHEAGHGMYEQGLPAEEFGLPPGRYASLGIHESQSRLWENFVGRGRAFWTFAFPAARQAFPAALQDVELDAFFHAVNEVRPSLIRIEADEATYNLHSDIRFQLEQALVTGELPVADLPQAWAESYGRVLGVAPPNDSQGVLQDIHWSAGLVGYFPTYTLGNLYAAQFWEQADQDLGGLDVCIARGEFQPLLGWLREQIHRHGQCYDPSDLIRRVTGRSLEAAPLLRHLRQKLGAVYSLQIT